MRGSVNQHDFGDYRFNVEFDSGAGPDTQHAVWVYHRTGEPLLDDRGFQVRRYFKEYNERHVRNFCMKFASDAEYRSQFLTK